MNKDEEAEDLLEEYVGIVDAVTEALGPMTRKDREDQLDCDATVSIRVRNLRATADHLQAVLDRVRTLVSDTPTKYDRIVELERERDEALAAAKESAVSDMDSLQRLRAVEPALERARVERDDAERARDEWKARAEKAEAERDEARAEAARLSDLHRRCEAYDDQSGPSCVVLRARLEDLAPKLREAERDRDEARKRVVGLRASRNEARADGELAGLRASRNEAEATQWENRAHEWRARSERAETELREVLSALEGGGPATETLFALAQRGTAKKIRALLGLTLAPEVGS